MRYDVQITERSKEKLLRTLKEEGILEEIDKDGEGILIESCTTGYIQVIIRKRRKEDSRLKENYQRLFTEAVEIRRERDQLRKEIEKKEQEIDELKRVMNHE